MSESGLVRVVLLRRTAMLRGMALCCVSALSLALAGCIPFLDPPAGASVEIVNEAGVSLWFQHRGRQLPVPKGQTVTLELGTGGEATNCASDVRVVDADHTMELIRDEVCDGETWVIEADDLAPIEP